MLGSWRLNVAYSPVRTFIYNPCSSFWEIFNDKIIVSVTPATCSEFTVCILFFWLGSNWLQFICYPFLPSTNHLPASFSFSLSLFAFFSIWSGVFPLSTFINHNISLNSIEVFNDKKFLLNFVFHWRIVSLKSIPSWPGPESIFSRAWEAIWGVAVKLADILRRDTVMYVRWVMRNLCRSSWRISQLDWRYWHKASTEGKEVAIDIVLSFQLNEQAHNMFCCVFIEKKLYVGNRNGARYVQEIVQISVLGDGIWSPFCLIQ